MAKPNLVILTFLVSFGLWGVYLGGIFLFLWLREAPFRWRLGDTPSQEAVKVWWIRNIPLKQREYYCLMENLHFNTSWNGSLSVQTCLSPSVPVCLSTNSLTTPLHCDVTFSLRACINLSERQIKIKYDIMTRYCFFNRFMMQKPSSVVGSDLTDHQK